MWLGKDRKSVRRKPAILSGNQPTYMSGHDVTEIHVTEKFNYDWTIKFVTLPDWLGKCIKRHVTELSLPFSGGFPS